MRFRPSQYELFRREIDILKNMDHPNIIKGYEYYEGAHHIYFVMDLCEGGELFDRIKSKSRYSEADAAKVLHQVLSGISYLHERKIAHCDLKPDNFLFLDKTEDSNLKIIDFGMSKYTSSREYMATLAGTSFYMAPEVLQGRYTFHCDMWSFGVVMFIMLFGFPPFHGASDLIIHNKIAKGFHAQVKKGYGPYFPASIKVSDKARDLLGKLLHSDPAIRLTANEALSHPWFHSADKNPLAEAVLGGIQTFTANCQFKQAVLGALSTSLTADELRDLKDSFKKMDLNGDGVVTVDELKQALQREEEQGEESKIAQSMVKLMEMADVDGDGALSYEELVMASVQQRLLAKEERLYNTFCQLDQDRNGTVTAEEIEQVLGEQDDVKQMIAEIDKDGDGQISYAEFVAMFTAKESAAEMKAMDLEKPSTTTA